MKVAGNKQYTALSKEIRSEGRDNDNRLFGTLKRRGYWRRE